MNLSDLRQKPHLSASSIGDYIDCGMLYKFGRVDRLPRQFVADAMEFGTVIHAVLAEYYQSKMTGDRMLLKDIHDLFKDLWQQTAYGRDDIQYAVGKDFDTLMMNGIDLLTAWYHKLPDDDFKVIGIEEAFSFTLPGVSVPVIGGVDLLEEDSAGTIIITDFKSSARSYSIDEIDNNMQMTMYQLAMKKNGFADREILLRFDCLIKTKTPKFEQYYTTRSAVDELRLIRKIEKVWEGINRGIFIPNDTTWKHKNCPYRKICDEWFLNGGETDDKALNQ
jgi:putative RecB family exonuclease